MPVQPFVQLWIWLSTFAIVAGWALSACGQLNRAGYAAAFACFILFIGLVRKIAGVGQIKNVRAPLLPGKLLRRFRRPLPLCFLALSSLIFLGACLYPPDNYMALTYRIPRVLHWLAHGGWLWIHTINYRMNDRACGMEWLSAPLMLFSHSLRPLFLLNFIPFLLLPGLTYSVFIRLGVSPRVAWQWMWLLPTAYNFALQAGGMGNDTFPAVYALAAMDFALRFRQSARPLLAVNSLLSAALLVGAKASNLPLLLPWAILFLTHDWRRVSPRTFACLAAVAIPAIVISFLPTAILNHLYCGDWTGAILEPPNMTVKNPLVGFAGNAFQLLTENFCPPFFPEASWWNSHAGKIVPAWLLSVSNHFDTGFFQLAELPTEDLAGAGFGLCALALVFILAKCFVPPAPERKPSQGFAVGGKRLRFCLLLAPWLALLVYCAKSGMTFPARLISPYYPLLLPLLLAGSAPLHFIRGKLWRVLVFGNIAIALAVIILTPPRPLWPAQTILARLAAAHPGSPLISRAQRVYSLYSQRFDALATVRSLLPDNVAVIGFAGGQDDAETSLWLPLGSRRVKDFLVTDNPAKIRQQGIQYVIINAAKFGESGLTSDQWLNQAGAELLAVTHVTLKIATGDETFYLIRFKSSRS